MLLIRATHHPMCCMSVQFVPHVASRPIAGHLSSLPLPEVAHSLKYRSVSDA